MEYQVNEEFEHNGKKYICKPITIEQNAAVRATTESCETYCSRLGCAFAKDIISCSNMVCVSDERKDEKEVYFVEL